MVTTNTTAEWDALPESEKLYSYFSDFYKDVHGIRPRWLTAEERSNVEFLREQIRFLASQE